MKPSGRVVKWCEEVRIGYVSQRSPFIKDVPLRACRKNLF
jgi:ABC-type Mn2+/Zn2+ transport system ATPase subunit